jgi:hypothetical protein
METRNHCAYNHTRECFLGLEVAEADIQYASLEDLIATLTLKSGEGLWIVPFKEIPATGTGIPLDLIYLDEDLRVLEVVESFLTLRETPSIQRAASVLALPTHTIYSSQTQPGDQLVICQAEEMEGRLELLSDLGGHAGTVQSAVLLREEPLWSGGPGLLELGDRSKVERPGSLETHEMGLVEPGKKEFKPPKSWLKRWWSPDPRRAPREPAPGLAAYYWTGAPPEPHSIRDISATGLYLVTEERWYPGTLVLMTLQRTANGEETAEHTIQVHSRAVRWGNDGVGLQFVLPDSKDAQSGQQLLVNAVDRKELDRFLQGLRKSKG